MKIKVSQYIADFLVKNDITHCFMVTGGGAMHLDDAIGHKEGITCIFNHHEQGCAIAAEGYARVTGKPAAVCVTTGPGGTNAITGVMGGWVDSIPMFVISGQVKRETTIYSCPDIKLRQLGDQEFDIVTSVSNMTKYAVIVWDPNEIAYHLEKGLWLALNGRPGPVWIDVPLDIQSAYIETDSLLHFNPDGEYTWRTPSVTKRQAQDILDKISSAEAPLILTGTGIRVGDAEEEFSKLVAMLKIPVVTAWSANDTIPYDSPYYAGVPGTMGTRSGNFAVQNCDLLITLGCRNNIRMIGYNHHQFAENAYKIIVDIDPNELSKPTIKADMPVNADVKQLINVLLECDYTPSEKHEKWVKWCRSLVEKYPVPLPEYYNKPSPLVNPYVFLDELFRQLDSNDKIVCSNGSACVMTIQTAKIKRGQRMFANSGCASMGYGLPAAVGAALADDRRTICLEGDGSIMMNLQELATIAHNRLNVKIFMISNNGYLSIRQTQRNLFKPPFVGIDSSSGLSFPDFGKIAEAFGIRHFLIDDKESAKSVIGQALACDGPCFCEVVVDPDQNFEPKSSSKILEDGRIVSAALDDMAPFLDRDEFEATKYKG